MYATNLLLLLPADDRRRLLDAGGEVSGRLFLQRWDDRRARRVPGRMVAARMEDASGRRIRRRRNVALKNDSLLARLWIGDGNGRQQCLRVRHERLAIEIVGARQLDHLAEV